MKEQGTQTSEEESQAWEPLKLGLIKKASVTRKEWARDREIRSETGDEARSLVTQDSTCLKAGQEACDGF